MYISAWASALLVLLVQGNAKASGCETSNKYRLSRQFFYLMFPNNCGISWKINKNFINLWCSRHEKRRQRVAAVPLSLYILTSGVPHESGSDSLFLPLWVAKMQPQRGSQAPAAPHSRATCSPPSEAAPEKVLFLIIFSCKTWPFLTCSKDDWQ